MMSDFAPLPWLLLASAVSSALVSLVVTLFPRISLVEASLMAPALGLSVSAWLVMIVKSLPFMRSGIPVEVIMIVVGIQMAITAWLYPRAKALLASHRQRVRDDLKYHRGGIIMLSIMAVWWAYNNHIHYLFRRGNDHIAGGSVYADLPFHLNLVTSFLNGCNENATVFSSLMSSFYAGATLAYPFMPDFYLSVLVAAGFDIRMSLVSTGAILLSALSGLIYALNSRLTGCTTAGMLSVWLAILSGGLGGFVYASQEPGWWTWANLTSHKFIHGPDHVLYWAGGRGGYWFALTPHILFPQRTVQHAYPLALTVLLLAWEAFAGRPSVHKALAPPPPAPPASSSSSSGASARLAAIQSVRKRKGGKDAPEAGAGEEAAAPAPAAYSATYADSPTWYTRPAQLKMFAVTGFVAGLLPLMQPHSFVSVGVITLVMALCQGFWLLAGAVLPASLFASKPAPAVGAGAVADSEESKVSKRDAAASNRWGALVDAILQWGTYGAVAAAFALPQMMKHLFHRVSFGQGGHSGFVRFNPVWKEEGKGLGPVATWWNALGLFIPTYLLGALLLRKREQVAIYAGFVALFVVANLVMFQPWHMDNTKVFAVWIFSAGFAASVIVKIATVTRRLPLPFALAGKAVAAALFGALIFSGFLGAWREMMNNAKVYDDLDFDLAGWIRDNTPASAVFMTDPSENNHIRAESSLAGRQVAQGYLGWLSSHGLDMYRRSSALHTAMRGGPEAVAALRAEKITHITVDAGSFNKFDAGVLDDLADPVATNGKSTVWAVLPEIVNGTASGGKKCKSARGGAKATPEACREAGCWHLGGSCVKKFRERDVVDCAPAGSSDSLTADACRKDLKCIWSANGSSKGQPQCQKPRWQLLGRAPEQVKALTKRIPGSDCGWSSMSPADCTARGCHWGPNSDPYGPWCVYT